MQPTLLVVLLMTARPGGALPERELRVCADPNNLPFSNQRGEGFENKLAELVARALDARLSYVWWGEGRGFFRNTLEAGRCEVVMGVPALADNVLATRPYYRSSYVFVWRKGSRAVRSLDDPTLRSMRIGVPVAGDDGGHPPPVYSLTRRGIVDNVELFSVHGDHAAPNPPLRIMEALAGRQIDVAVVWGPQAGFFARTAPAPLELAPVAPASDGGVPFVFEISIGVRRGDSALRRELDAVLARQRPEVERILDDFRVPRL
jgi:mxaJ protein